MRELFVKLYESQKWIPKELFFDEKSQCSPYLQPRTINTLGISSPALSSFDAAKLSGPNFHSKRIQMKEGG